MPLPDHVDDRTAAAILLKGATTAFLIEDCAKVQPGWPVLVHAAAGGVGHLAVGWLKAIGATVIATVGSEAKAEKARAAGADHVILNRQEDVAARVREITGGQGVPVVLDGVGKATWEASLNSAARRGLVVSFGNASGAVDGVNLGVLAAKGSLFVTRPTLFDYAVTAAEKRSLIARVFAMLEKRAITPEIGQSFALTDVAEAHRAIEAGETVGSTVLIPERATTDSPAIGTSLSCRRPHAWRPSMIALLPLALLALQAAPAAPPAPTTTEAPKPVMVRVAMQTSLGPVVLDLDRTHAPITTANFLRYVDQHRLDGVTFYRSSASRPISASSSSVSRTSPSASCPRSRMSRRPRPASST